MNKEKFDNVLCVIPARGGSKGIPQKNTRMLGNKPLVAHSIRHAIESGIPVQNIVVSSDDQRILDIAEMWNVCPHRRSDKNSQDNSSTESCLIEVCDSRCDHIDAVVTLQPTSPIRMKGRLCQCLESYERGGYDSLVAVSKLYNFLWYEECIDEAYKWKSTYDVFHRPMRQDLGREDLRYFDCGNLYISNMDMLLSTGCRLGENLCVFPISDLESMQIDSDVDLNIFRCIFDGDVEQLSLSGAYA